jgi:glycosyltransferase involved in cell wall biosynthesis
LKIVIDALSQVGAGSRTYLENVLPRLGTSALSADWEYVIHWPDGVRLPDGVEGRENLRVRPLPVPQKPALIRLIHQQLILPFLVREADIFFAPVDTAPIFCPAPVVLALRNPNPFYRMKRSLLQAGYFWLKRQLITASARSARRVLFVSEHSRDVIASQIKLPDRLTRVIYHGLDHDRFQPAARSNAGDVLERRDLPEHYLLLVSTVTPHKNMETLIEAYAGLKLDLQKKYPLLIVGRIAQKAYHDQLLSLAGALGVEKSIRFMGEVNYSEMHEIYQGAEIFVLPSLMETFGHTLVEAMACGIPVAASRRTAVPEILGGAGLLFDPEKPAELQHILESLLRDPDLKRKLSERGIQRADHFSWERTTAALEQVFEELSSSSDE